MHLNKEELNMWKYNYCNDDELMHFGVDMKWGKQKDKAAYKVVRKKAENEDALGDKRIAKRKAAKQQYKVVKKKCE